ncbi:MAG: hypothetical protein AABM33_12030 [Pseudomonadota bacterium]
MRTLGFWVLLLALAGCATVERPKPLTGADVVSLAKTGKTAPEIIAELKRTDTVLPLQASDFLKLHEAGVPAEVLDYLQRAQIDEIRWRDRHSQMYWYGPGFGPHFGWGPCPWPGRMRPYRGGPWGC